MADLTTLIELSRSFGADPNFTLLGGGNTSYKEGPRLYVKASGVYLKDLDESQVVVMDQDKLKSIWSRSYPAETAPREAEVLKDILSARLPGQTIRPSVEALFHSFIKGAYVIHTHPALINGFTCGREGEAALEELFEGEALWIPLMEPGYILAGEAKKRIEAFEQTRRRYPRFIFLQNHGIFVPGENREEILALHKELWERCLSRINRVPEARTRPLPPESLGDFQKEAVRVFGEPYVLAGSENGDILEAAQSPGAFAPLEIAYTPDHLFYAGVGPCYLTGPGDLAGAAAAFRKRWERDPVSFIVKDLGALGGGKTPKAAEESLLLIEDAVKIKVYAESAGGVQPLTPRIIQFVLNWEAEKYKKAAMESEAKK
ncbi:MAG: class II aldolase/adducin family protein [Spirochaetales bacterium]|jgi:rhamnose utilization protein RhaD (predicted bifunctional aldolase and dehydrogenase)|nr:class II aldolase/adducin family protein [Spirochaetales bacterium]